MAKVKKTPAYVQKAIEWLKKNSPEGEDLAFINDQEAALLKSLGGSGEEVVDGVRSYVDIEGWGDGATFDPDVSTDPAALDLSSIADWQAGVHGMPGGYGGWGGPDIAGIRRSQEDAANREFLNELRRRAAAGEFDEAGRTADQEAAFTLEGGAEAQRQALAKSNILDIPTRPDAPTLETPTLTAGQDELISPQGLGVAMAPTIDPVQTVDPTGLSPDAPTRVPAATTTAAQVADTGQAQAATQVAPTQVIGDIQEAIPTEELAQAATADLDERATVKFQLEQITSTIKDGEPLPSWAAPAARSADALMLQRGLGSSSMAASARTQALIEAGLPIASSDAQAYGRIQLQNLNNKQAAALQNANTLAAMRTQNLNARMTAAVNNARNFLTIDTTNLNNKQASNTLTFQANQQKLFTNQAAENAARQFNATSENQVEQFFSTLENSVSQANANRLTAVRQFNAGETNAFNQFIANQELAREQFNANQLASIRAANANWFRSIATINNGNQMAANSFAAQATLGLREKEYNQLWQKRRDDASYIFSSTEAGLDRIAAEAALAQQAAIARGNQKASKSSGLFSALGAIAGGFLKSDIRLKTNIEKIGELNSTISLYRWEWNEVAEKMGVDNQPSVGVLAQELIEYRPDLVMMYEDGYFRVNYSGLLS
jgi:hypothetical protein